jgi:hypothetical protein
MKRLIPVIVVIALALGPGLAQEESTARRAAEPNGVVEIELIDGSVTVTGWDRAEVELGGGLAECLEALEFTGSGNRTVVRLEHPGGCGGAAAGADLIVRAPHASEVKVETISADIEVTEVTGVAVLATVSGAIEVTGVLSEADLSTMSGAIGLTSGGVLKRGRFQSVSGGITVATGLSTDGRYNFETVSGPIVIRLPANVSADFEVETFSGEIRNQFGPEARKATEFLPAKELSFTAGKGGARVTAESVSGTIELTRE